MSLSAFQSNAFQSNAFQIARAARSSATQPDPGSRIVGGHFSRGRWRDLINARRALESEATARKRRRHLEQLAKELEQEALARAGRLERAAKLDEKIAKVRAIGPKFTLLQFKAPEPDDEIALIAAIEDDDD